MAEARRPIAWLRLVAVLLAGTALFAAPGAIAGPSTPATTGSHLTASATHVLGVAGRGFPHAAVGFVRHRPADAAAMLPVAALVALFAFALVGGRGNERVVVRGLRAAAARAPPADRL